jgi:Inner membrane protein YgaP-like, transmembrane domain
MRGRISNTNRIIRLSIAAIIAVLYFTGTVTGTLAIVLVVIGGMMILTGLISVCPMAMMGICPGDLVKKMVAKKGA